MNFYFLQNTAKYIFFLWCFENFSYNLKDVFKKLKMVKKLTQIFLEYFKFWEKYKNKKIVKKEIYGSRLKESSNHNEDRVKLMLKKLKVNFCIIVIDDFWNGKTLWNTTFWLLILKISKEFYFLIYL